MLGLWSVLFSRARYCGRFVVGTIFTCSVMWSIRGQFVVGTIFTCSVMCSVRGRFVVGNIFHMWSVIFSICGRYVVGNIFHVLGMLSADHVYKVTFIGSIFLNSSFSLQRTLSSAADTCGK